MARRRRRQKSKPKRIPWWRRVTSWATAHGLRLLMIFLGLLIVAYLLLWFVFVWPQHYVPPVECSHLPLAVSLRYPYYVAGGSESFVEVGLRNTGSQPISGTTVIAFGGDLSVHPVPAKTNFFSFTALPPGGIMAEQVRFTFNEPPARRRGALPFTVHITADQTCALGLPGSPLRLSPVLSLMATLSSLLSISGLALLWKPITALAGLLWEQIKKWWFPENR